MPSGTGQREFEELIKPDRLGAALAEVTGDHRWSKPSWDLVRGGKSNLTFMLSSDAGDFVLRRPPTGELLPKAHDMRREARIQAALAGSRVPVPRIVLTDDGDLIGTPCYVMERIEGPVVRDQLPPLYAGTEERRVLGHAFVDTLAAIHTTDPASIGLADFGRPEGFLERQVGLWIRQWEQSRTHEVSAMTELGRRLSTRIPDHQRNAIVHGDYRLDNLVLDPTRAGVVAAVLDWELSTLGDPLTDLGLLMLFWRGPGDLELSLIPGVSHLAGMPSRDDLLQTYADSTGTDLGDMGFYQAFAHFKFAAITQGVLSRSRSGAAAGQDFGDLDDEVRGLAARGLEHL